MDCHNLATDARTPQLADYPDVVELRLAGHKGFTDDGLKVIPKLPKLRELQLTGENITSAGLAYLADPGCSLFRGREPNKEMTVWKWIWVWSLWITGTLAHVQKWTRSPRRDTAPRAQRRWSNRTGARDAAQRSSPTDESNGARSWAAVGCKPAPTGLIANNR